MRRIAIILFFFVMLTLSLRLGDWEAFLACLVAFIGLFHMAEDLDDDGYRILK